MKEEVISKNTNSKKIILIVILLALIIASGISALLLTDNHDKIKDNEKEKIKETSKEENTQFIIKEEGSLFVANDNYFKDGSKELLTNKVHELTEGVTYKEKYYYIDNEDNLIVYENGQETIVLEDVYMNTISIGKNIYIKGSFMDDSTAEYYIYDTASSELTTTKNEYVKKILNSIY